MRLFTADFETSTAEWLKYDNNARVWAYSIYEIEEHFDNFIYGNNINDFMNWCANPKENYKVFFHNLAYDGRYIIEYLLKNGFEYIEDKKLRRDKTFTTLISVDGIFYSIEIYFTVQKKKVNKVTILDSLKLLNFSVDKIAKDFDLPIRKLELDYNLYRPENHQLTEDEINYIRNDVEIVARALYELFNRGYDKMTIASNALHDFKNKIGNKYQYLYPKLPNEIHDLANESYRGGFTYVNPANKDKITKELIVLDVNSLYPSVLRYKPMPYGKPILYDGEYKRDIVYPLYIQYLSCRFELKKGKIPTIQIKGHSIFLRTEYLENSKDEIVFLALTSVDLKLFLENYDVYDLTYLYGYKFKCVSGVFDSYIDSWTNEKIKAKKEGNKSMYAISKLFLNSLYGKFGSGRKSINKIPYINEDGILDFIDSDIKDKNTVYMPVATFTTAYAREKTIRTSQKIRDWSINKYGEDRYCYSDTDSIHFICKSEYDEKGNIVLTEDSELLDILDIDDYKLGWWKIESRAKRGKFLHAKCYIEEPYEEDSDLNVTIAGLPKRLGKLVTFENFKHGMRIKAEENPTLQKLIPVKVNGGVVLKAIDFTIK